MKRPLYLVFGGGSSERLVSTATAQNLHAHLPHARVWFLSKMGKVFEVSADELRSHAQAFTQEFVPSASAQEVAPSLEEATEIPELQESVLFLAMHGQGVEDGVLQTLLEQSGIAFTGSGSKASALAFHKAKSKEVAAKKGVRIAQSFELNSRDPVRVADQLSSALAKYKKIAVKPVADGSSVGLRILDQKSDLKEAASGIAQDGRVFLVESFLSGTELTVGVITNSRYSQALPPSMVKLDTDRNFDYQAKYLGKGVEELTPAPVSAEVTRAAQELAFTMHQALGCAGYSRTDMIVTTDGPVYLETNTLPGMTKASFFPQQLQAAGISMVDFLNAEIDRAWNSTH